MIVKPIKLGNFKVDAQKNFQFLTQEPTTSIKMGIQPFVVLSKNDVILVDAGISCCESMNQLLLLELENQGVYPEQFTKIVLSHMHKDHIEGLAYELNGEWIQNFPDAMIYLQKREFEYALSQSESYSYNQSLLNAMKNWENIVWLTADRGQISEEITYLVTGGHSPFHQVFWFKESDEVYFYGGDNLPTLGYLKTHIAYKTDYDGKKAREWRKEWEQLISKENWKVMFYHDLKESIYSK